MDLNKIAARVAGDTAHVKVTEGPNRVEVTLRGKVHSGTWTEYDEDTGDDGYVDADEGSDEMLLQSAMAAWGGDEESDIPVDELEAQGYWTDSPPAQ